MQNNVNNNSSNNLDNKITFIINYQEYTIDLTRHKNKDNKGDIKQILQKYLTTNKNVDINALLLAYINQSKDLLELEDQLEQLYAKIQNN